VCLIIAILTYLWNTNKDKKSEIKQEDMTINGLKEGILKANMKLDQVCATTNETRTDIKSLAYNLSEIDKRLCVVENEVKDLKKKVGEKDD
jgi:septal ring factor EnvC (AmiA/AmiB activator)